jgi:single-stranded DNA-binding protein
MFNKTTLVGRLANDPQLKYTPTLATIPVLHGSYGNRNA